MNFNYWKLCKGLTMNKAFSVAFDRGTKSAILSLITSFFHSFILKNELQFFCLCIDSYTLNFYCAFIVFCYKKWWKRNCYMLQLKDRNHFISKWKLVIVAQRCSMYVQNLIFNSLVYEFSFSIRPLLWQLEIVEGQQWAS